MKNKASFSFSHLETGLKIILNFLKTITMGSIKKHGKSTGSAISLSTLQLNMK